MEGIIIALLASVIGPAIVAVVNHFVENHHRPKDKFSELTNKVDVVLNDQRKLEAKNDLWFLYLRYIDKPFDYDTLLRVRDTYGKYHNLGGNGEGTYLFRRLVEQYAVSNGKEYQLVIDSCLSYLADTYPDWN